MRRLLVSAALLVIEPSLALAQTGGVTKAAIVHFYYPASPPTCKSAGISANGSEDWRGSRVGCNYEDDIMAGTTNLSVEKALEKLRGDEPPKIGAEQIDEKTEAQEIKRMRTQRLRLDPTSRKPN